MTERILYVPILKWKKGEQNGLVNLSDSVKNQIRPLIEITELLPPDEICIDMKEVFQNPMYIDTVIADEDDRDYLFSIISELNSNNLSAYPVLYYDDFYNDLSNLVKVSDKLCCKIDLPLDIEGPDIDEILNLMDEFYSTYNQKLDLILDIGIIENSREAALQLREALDFASNVTKFDFFDNIILSSTSFPSSLSNIHSNESKSFHRFDIKVFENFLSKTTISKEKILYADYGVTKFTDIDTELDFSKIGGKILDKVRYTTDTDYWVYKGKKDKRNPSNSVKYVNLAKIICASPFYYGKNFSFGDGEIYDRANGLNKKKGGNHTNWVTISSNHHITVLVQQLSSLF